MIGQVGLRTNNENDRSFVSDGKEGSRCQKKESDQKRTGFASNDHFG